MHSLIDIINKSKNKYSIVEPKKPGNYITVKGELSGSISSTELFNIKGSGVVKSLDISPYDDVDIGVKIEIDGKTVYDSTVRDKDSGYYTGYIANNSVHLIFGDISRLYSIYANSEIQHYYRTYYTYFKYYSNTRILPEQIFPFDISKDNMTQTFSSSQDISKNTLFLFEGGIEFKKSFIVSANHIDSTSAANIYAGIEYDILNEEVLI